ncbi:MAG: hypothetical protein KDA66_04570 [Planctomycetaceae bacterium]|nr:hypothetical protein [Planctomycetaceae bacterium]
MYTEQASLGLKGVSRIVVPAGTGVERVESREPSVRIVCEKALQSMSHPAERWSIHELKDKLAIHGYLSDDGSLYLTKEGEIPRMGLLETMKLAVGREVPVVELEEGDAAWEGCKDMSEVALNFRPLPVR